MLCMNLLNLAKTYELQFQYAKLMECYKFDNFQDHWFTNYNRIAQWFTKKFLGHEDDEFSANIINAYNKAKEEVI